MRGGRPFKKYAALLKETFFEGREATEWWLHLGLV
jgi:hypothetical protein